MAIISISIPDDLKVQLENIKDRINISKVCREAITNKVDQLTPIPKDDKKFEALIHNLRGLILEFQNEWYNYGFKDGVRDFERLNYAEIKYIRDYECLSEADGEELFQKYEDETPEGLAVDYESWERGYVDGINSIYRKIQNLL